MLRGERGLGPPYRILERVLEALHREPARHDLVGAPRDVVAALLVLEQSCFNR